MVSGRNQRLMKLQFDEPLPNFAFKFNLRRYSQADGKIHPAPHAG